MKKTGHKLLLEDTLLKQKPLAALHYLETQRWIGVETTFCRATAEITPEDTQQ